jgi:hypothetical protein
MNANDTLWLGIGFFAGLVVGYFYHCVATWKRVFNEIDRE